MLELVPLKLEYCEQVYELAKKCLPEHWSLDGIRDVLEYDNNIYYVAVEISNRFKSVKLSEDNIADNQDGHIVGFGGIMIVADETELLNIAVSEQYRRNGIAQALLDRLLESAKYAGCRRMLLEVRSTNSAAQHLYKKKGFVELGIRKNYYSNPTDDAIIMERCLL